MLCSYSWWCHLHTGLSFTPAQWSNSSSAQSAFTTSFQRTTVQKEAETAASARLPHHRSISSMWRLVADFLSSPGRSPCSQVFLMLPLIYPQSFFCGISWRRLSRILRLQKTIWKTIFYILLLFVQHLFRFDLIVSYIHPMNLISQL